MGKPSSGWIYGWPHINACTCTCIDTNPTPTPRANTSWPLRNSLRLTTQQTPYSACPILQPHHCGPRLCGACPHSSTPSSKRVIAISQPPRHRFDRRIAAGLMPCLPCFIALEQLHQPQHSECRPAPNHKRLLCIYQIIRWIDEMNNVWACSSIVTCLPYVRTTTITTTHTGRSKAPQSETHGAAW